MLNEVFVEASDEAMPVMQRLPMELLAEIFLNIDHWEDDGELVPWDSDARYQAHTIAVTIACVCKTWRAVARATGQLWSLIVINQDTRHWETYVDTCIALSGNHDLTIQCDLLFTMPDVLRMLLPHAARWSAVELKCDFDDIRELSRSGRSFPSLRVVSFAGGPLRSDVPELFDFLSESSQLKALSLKIEFCHRDYVFSLPPLSNITSFRVNIRGNHLHSPAALIHALEPSQSTLQSFSASFQTARVLPEVTNQPPVLLPALRKLSLDRSAHICMKSITAPNLEQLCLYPLGTRRFPSEDHLFDSLLAFLSRSPSPHAIRELRLTIRDWELDENSMDMLFSCLRRLDSLQVLHILHIPRSSDILPVSSELILALTVRGDGLPLLPNLRSMEFRPGSYFYSEGDREALRALLRTMARSRATPRVVCGREVAALERYEVDITHDIL